MARIIDSVLVDDNRADESTELDQCGPVAAIARQARRLDRERSADATLANRGQQALKAGPADPIARATQIIVDDLYRSPTELPGAVSQPVLPSPAFVIVHKLIGSRLTDVRCSAVILVIDDPSVCERCRDLEQQRFDQGCKLRHLCGRQHNRGLVLFEQDFVGDVGIVASSLFFSVSESDWRNPRSASTSARRDRKISMENRGSLHNLNALPT